MIRELDYYVEKLHPLYKYIPKKTFRKILEHGFNMYYDLASRGGAVYIGDSRFSALCAYTNSDWSKIKSAFTRYHNHKLRKQYTYQCVDYDGVYYFGVTEEQKEKLFTNECEPITCHKIKDECLRDARLKYFYMLYYPVDRGWTFPNSSIEEDDVEYFAYRDERNKIIEING